MNRCLWRSGLKSLLHWSALDCTAIFFRLHRSIQRMDALLDLPIHDTRNFSNYDRRDDRKQQLALQRLVSAACRGGNVPKASEPLSTTGEPNR